MCVAVQAGHRVRRAWRRECPGGCCTVGRRASVAGPKPVPDSAAQRIVSSHNPISTRRTFARRGRLSEPTLPEVEAPLPLLARPPSLPLRSPAPVADASAESPRPNAAPSRSGATGRIFPGARSAPTRRGVTGTTSRRNVVPPAAPTWPQLVCTSCFCDIIVCST